MQQDLDVIEQHAPAAPLRACRQMLRQILAKRLLGCGKLRQRRVRRQPQVPMIGRGNHELHVGFLEHRPQRFGQRQRFVHCQLQLPAGEQAHAVHVRLHPGRIGRQPQRLAGVAMEELAGDGSGCDISIDAVEVVAEPAQVTAAAGWQPVRPGQPCAHGVTGFEMRERRQPAVQRLGARRLA